MSVDNIVSVSITRKTKYPSRKGFGTAMLLVSKVPTSWGTKKKETYGNTLTELTDDGFLVTDPAYLMAQILLAQNPTVKSFKVAKRTLPPTKSIKLTVTNATEGYVYNFKVNGTVITYTVPAAQTTTQVATALELLIEAVTDITSSSAVNVITMGAPAGTLIDVEDWIGTDNSVPGGDSGMLLEDATTDPGIATDLAAVYAMDSDWYAIVVDSMGKLEAAAASTWAEANKILLMVDAADSEILDSGDTNDAVSVAKAASQFRTCYWVSNTKLLHWTSCGILGSRLTRDPGSDTWKFKTLSNVTPAQFTEGEKTAIHNKNGNTYTEVGGLTITEEGKTAGGEFADIMRFSDWLQAEIQTDVYATLANAEKLPFTNAGADVLKGVVSSVLNRGIKVGGLSNDVPPSVDAPLVETVSAGNKAARNYPDITFLGTFAGAIHFVGISGTIGV